MCPVIYVGVGAFADERVGIPSRFQAAKKLPT